MAAKARQRQPGSLVQSPAVSCKSQEDKNFPESLFDVLRGIRESRPSTPTVVAVVTDTATVSGLVSGVPIDMIVI